MLAFPPRTFFSRLEILVLTEAEREINLGRKKTQQTRLAKKRERESGLLSIVYIFTLFYQQQRSKKNPLGILATWQTTHSAHHQRVNRSKADSICPGLPIEAIHKTQDSSRQMP
jgi:hypothetical protein